MPASDATIKQLVKRCENCQRLFGPKRRKNGTFEYPSQFAPKRFCSPTCSGIFNEIIKKTARDAEQRA